MKIRTLIGLVLVVAGLGITLYGLGSALMELVGLYAGALNDPLADPANGGERGISRRMGEHAIAGAFGVPLLIIGYFLLHMGLMGVLRKKKR